MNAIEIENITLTGAWQGFLMKEPIVSIAVQNRAASDVLFSDTVTGIAYSTIKSGNSFTFEGYNLGTEGQTVYFKGTGVLEIIKQITK